MTSYSIVFAQQPTHGYAIHSNDSAARTKRLTPPLIVQCFQYDEYTQTYSDIPESTSAVLVAYVHLYTGDGVHRYEQVPIEGIYQNLLAGNLVANAVKHRDGYNRIGVYFSFPDLSVRLSGTYRLAVYVHHMGLASGQGWAAAVASGLTGPFEVYE
ncbi:uncharacterized protein VTP21DRAFT_9120 [Calcarisporiella thermophila]|uniref:uncharacterized protein n=1 Tax=Calcarisporiella thermophila TaxID=911321 RepID=UPI0037423EFB